MEKFTAAEMRQVIGDASRPAASDVGYTEAEVLTAAREVGLDERAVQASLRAVVTAREIRAARRGAIVWALRLGAQALFTLSVVLAGSYVAGVSHVRMNLRVTRERIDAQRAQVRRVVMRQAETAALWQRQAASNERNAELSGSINRVAIEVRRYDVLVREYNDMAGAWWGCRARSATELPARFPYSNEVQSW